MVSSIPTNTLYPLPPTNASSSNNSTQLPPQIAANLETIQKLLADWAETGNVADLENIQNLGLQLQRLIQVYPNPDRSLQGALQYIVNDAESAVFLGEHDPAEFAEMLAVINGFFPPSKAN